MNRYPAKPMMDEMAKYGRYGDTMLVHMNPVEVAGIASGSRRQTHHKPRYGPARGVPTAHLFGASAAKGLSCLRWAQALL